MTGAKATVAPIFQGEVLGISGYPDLFSAARLSSRIRQVLAGEGRNVVFIGRWGLPAWRTTDEPVCPSVVRRVAGGADRRE